MFLGGLGLPWLSCTPTTRGGCLGSHAIPPTGGYLGSHAIPPHGEADLALMYTHERLTWLPTPHTHTPVAFGQAGEG